MCIWVLCWIYRLSRYRLKLSLGKVSLSVLKYLERYNYKKNYKELITKYIEYNFYRLLLANF